MNTKIGFLSRNGPENSFFFKVADKLKVENIDAFFIKNIGWNQGGDIFQFELELEKIWNDIDITPLALSNLQAKFPNFNFMRALYSEREFNYFPLYYGLDPVSHEHQMKYLVGCFEIFDDWLDRVGVDFIVSELIAALDDAILKEVAEQKAVKYYSVRQSKMTPGVIVCNGYNDEPLGMKMLYSQYIKNEIPAYIRNKALLHISSLRSEIEHPSYMEQSKKTFSIAPFEIFSSLFKWAIGRNSPEAVTSLTVRSVTQFETYKSTAIRLINLYQMRINFDRWFTKELKLNEKFIIYPLHYEPESSTLVRAFHFSDQLALIKLIAKLLPLDVKLVVKEHGGNRGYRKPGFYREVSHLPNVVLRPPEYNVSELISSCLCVITLTGRMGWEATVNKKPVITLGDSFWSSIETVYNVQSWEELSESIWKCYRGEGSVDSFNEERLIAFTSSYIKCIYDGNFVPASDVYLTDDNIEFFKKLLLDLEGRL